MRPQSRSQRRGQPSRRGSVLILVLVVVLMLALAAANFSNLMTTELEAVYSSSRDVETRALVDSGAEYAAYLLEHRTEPGKENLQHNPQLFLGVTVAPSEQPLNNGRFTILAPYEHDPAAQLVRYGLMDESAKLNVNLIANLVPDENEARFALMGLPGMTEPVADAILDWVDADDNVRQNGAELETYESRNPPYSAKNGPIDTLEELLLVEGVTPELLFGEDANRNGLLDPNENDGDVSLPLDNADGVLQLGWSAFLTANSRELNLRYDGRTKIDLNNGLLTDLYDQLEEEFGEDAAKFVIAYRISGPKDLPPESETETGTVASTTNKATQEKQANDAMKGLFTSIAGAMSQGTGTVTRGGIDISKGGQNRIKSIWDIIGSRADVTIDGTNTTLSSPWSAEPGAVAGVLPQLVDALSTTPDPFLEGRININQARREVLLGLPKMTVQMVDAIIAAQSLEQAADMAVQRSTIGWLFAEQLVDIWGMRELDPYLTARGDVYRAQIVGFFDGGGPVTRVEVMIDGTQRPPRINQYRDLTHLGRGYPRMMFQAQ
ncbi:MAG TPA: hypothetical protein VFG20_15740 [Planctomycetaceae bacterium]|nr:hypothetical protein [Planctomycetaceae bacterium]